MTARAHRLMLAGDVMLGRGVDQILAHPGDPRLFEGYMTSATGYVTLAERRSGDLPRGVAPPYVWGDLLADLDARDIDLRIVNLETAITAQGTPEPKGINYRMHPANIDVLTAARIDACILANNHVLDWGTAGLTDTLDTLAGAGIATVGAGRDAHAAALPAILPLPGGGRLLILAFGAGTSGVPRHWAATETWPGVNRLADAPEDTLAQVRAQIGPIRQPGDLLLISLHWGGNWGFDIPAGQRALAHALIDEVGADIVFGHSSHHPKAIETYRDRIIFYGAGDLINDYEGIGGHADYHPDLGLAYILDIAPGRGRLIRLEKLAYRRRRFRLERADAQEIQVLTEMTSAPASS
ncbi:CapA family protein [Marimonas lutisalis]|uniref:CapA family protein n=1 Tax=Marimonas lutisalis TaxID=2545756 RepID=UPI0010F8F571|nr:CapA family protein [Marimonas lutisalis]